MSPTTPDHPSAAGDRARQSGVKSRLRPNRWWSRRVGNDGYAASLRRAMAAYARRVANSDVDALADVTGLATELDEAISQAIIGLREAEHSWTKIAVRLGVTRQGAQPAPDLGGFAASYSQN